MRGAFGCTLRVVPQPIPIEIDRASLLDLARGGNLYQERFAFVRELLQNAADATLVRLFEERGAAAFPTDARSIADLRAALEHHAIDVSIEGLDEIGPHSLRIRIRDHGTGIGRADLEFLGRLGASWRNPRRREVIDAMPEWLRPSGAFGIGLHSAFLVADEIRFRTTHFRDGEPLAIRLFRDEGGVSMEVERAAPLDAPGTEVSVDVKRYDFAREGPRLTEGNLDFEHDLLLDPPLDCDRAEAMALVRRTASGSIVPVRVEGAVVARAFDGAGAVFDAESGLEVSWLDDPEAYEQRWADRMRWPPKRDRRPQIFYRGAPSSSRLSFETDASEPFVVNVLFGTARDLLRLSRDYFSYAGHERLEAAIRSALPRVGPRWLDAGDPAAAPPSMRPWLARWLWREGVEVGNAWRAAPVATAPDGRPVTLGEIVEADVVELRRNVDSHGATWVRVPPLPFELDASSCLVAERDLRRAFPDVRREDAIPFTFSRGAVDVRLHGDLIRFARDGRRGIGDGAFRMEMGRCDVGPRATPVCHDDYLDLAFDDGAMARAFRLGSSVFPIEDPMLLSPFVVRGGVVTVPGIDRWVRFTAECARGGARPVDEVARRGWQFLVDFDPDVRGADALEARYDLDDVRRELETAFGIALPSADELRASLAARGVL